MKFFDRVKSIFMRDDKQKLRESIEEIIAESDYNEPELLEDEKELISNLLELRKLRAEEVMIPRSEIVSLSVNLSFDEALDYLKNEPYSRYPVYGENLDDLQGFVYAKDIFQYIKRTDFNCRKLLNKLLFVPSSIPIIDLLVKMRQEKIPIAVVVDEYGGTDGIVTPWDILREILGDMQAPEEEEEVIAEIQHVSPTIAIVDGRLPIEDFEKHFGEILTDEEKQEDLDTLNGLILYLAGRVPNRSEVIEHSAGIEFEILEATPRSVLKIKVINKKPE
jgi:magnesium and cobalt transporter